MQKNEAGPLQHSIQKLTQNESKAKAIRCLGENIVPSLNDFGFAENSYILQQKHETHTQIDKLDFMKIKNFCTSKNTIKKTKR